MFKKTLISLAVASSVALTGCLQGASTGGNADPQPQFNTSDSGTYPVFKPISSDVPVPSDLLYDTTVKDGTYSIALDSTNMDNPVFLALNQLSGASTNAPIDIKMSGAIDPSTVDANSVVELTPGDPTTLVPNPNQNVFLIKLDYASGDAITGLSNSEPPTIPFAATVQAAAGGDTTAGAELAARLTTPPYTAKVLDLNGTTVLRIYPMQPLDPGTRYEVVITDGVKDVNGKPLVADSSYADLASKTGVLTNLSAALKPVKQLIQDFWQPVATNYFQLNNAARTTLGEKSLAVGDIVLSYTFTTTPDEKVLDYIANPATYFEDRLTALVRDTAVKTVLAANPSAQYSDIKTAADGAISLFPDASTAAAMPTIFGASAPCNGTTGTTAINCAGTVLASPSAYGNYLPTPQSRPTSFDTSTIEDVGLMSAVAGKFEVDSSGNPAPGTVMAEQGTITLPYYLGTPGAVGGTPAQGQPIAADYWKPDSTLATTFNSAFSALGLSIPQADPTKSTAVNFAFPFPKKTADVTVPVLAMYSSGATLNAGNIPTVIFQHGITTDRSAALTFGTALIEAAKANGLNIAVIAIDQPLHGVVLTNSQDKLSLAKQLLSAAGLDTSAATQQAVVDGSFTTGVLNQIIAGGCTGATISSVLAGSCGATAQTEMYGAVSIQNTVANAGSIVPGLPHTTHERHFDYTADPSTNEPVPMDASLGKTYNKSGSLFINLANFLNSRDNLREAEVDLLNLRASIGAMDLDANGTADLSSSNVYFIGHSLGAIDGGTFVAVANGSGNANLVLKGANLIAPGGGVTRLLDNSPAFAPSILAGLSTAAGLSHGDLDLETYYNVLQATIDPGDPLNFAGDRYLAGEAEFKYTSGTWKTDAKPLLISEFVGNSATNTPPDQVVPNNAYPTPYGTAEPAPLSGTDPLIAASGAANMTTGANFTTTPVYIARYTKGTHSTPVLPTTTDETAAFKELVSEAAQIVLSGGTGISTVDTSVIKQ